MVHLGPKNEDKATDRAQARVLLRTWTEQTREMRTADPRRRNTFLKPEPFTEATE